MQFFVQDIREWGLKKIFSEFACTEESIAAFFERLRIQNRLLADVQSTAFSFPRSYNSIYERIKSRYPGMTCFMRNCEPLIQSMDKPSTSVQRKFRNQWDSCWDSFGESLGFSEDTVQVLRELGIRICFANDFEDLPDEVFRFYNVVLKWFVYTGTEGSIMETGLSPEQLLERMIVQCGESFVIDILEGL